MKPNTRQEIIRTAKRLFNEQGYNKVSTRDIADSLGISKGNLTYYFKKKEDILEAVVQEMHSNYKKSLPPQTLEELDCFFVKVRDVAVENAFYFWHYTQLAQLSESIKSIQSEVIGDMHGVLTETFYQLESKGIIRAEEYSGQHQQLIQILQMACIYWTPYSKLDNGINYEDFLPHVWGIVFPVLTNSGRQIYAEKIRLII